MNKEQLIDKLKELGITTKNCYPKNSFISNELPCVGLYGSEREEDFYFYNGFDKKIYTLKATNNEYPVEDFKGKKKYIVPLIDCEQLWEDKPFEELPDLPLQQMTLRHYACIKLSVQDSGLPWLDALIAKAK